MFDTVTQMTTLDELADDKRALDAGYGRWLTKLAVYARSGRWADDGYATAAAALAERCRMDRGMARSHVDAALKLQRLESLRTALADGEVSREHALVIASAYTPERAAAIEQLEPQLVDIARLAPPRGLRELVGRVTDAIDGDDGAGVDDAKFRRRKLHMSHSIDGMIFGDFVCDPEHGAILFTAINAEMERDFQGNDPRTSEQRRFDALANIVRRSLDRGEVGTSRAARPHLSIVVDLAELEGRAPAACAQVRNEAAYAGRVSRVTLERLLCDCTITRVLVDGPSQVLDVGRATRTIPPATFKAVAVRDRHCQGKGCTRPWWECEVHHRMPWHQLGGTNVDDLELRCHHCHRDEHMRLAIMRR